MNYLEFKRFVYIKSNCGIIYLTCNWLSEGQIEVLLDNPTAQDIIVAANQYTIEILANLLAEENGLDLSSMFVFSTDKINGALEVCTLKDLVTDFNNNAIVDVSLDTGEPKDEKVTFKMFLDGYTIRGVERYYIVDLVIEYLNTYMLGAKLNQGASMDFIADLSSYLIMQSSGDTGEAIELESLIKSVSDISIALEKRNASDLSFLLKAVVAYGVTSDTGSAKDLLSAYQNLFSFIIEMEVGHDALLSDYRDKYIEDLKDDTLKKMLVYFVKPSKN